MKRPPSTVTVGAAAAVLAAVLSGCSLFERSSSEESRTVPVPTSAAAASVVVSAGAKPSTTSSPTATPTSSTTAAAPSVTPTPPLVRGYTLTGSDVAAQRRFASVATQYRVVFSGLTSRRVVKGKDQLGSLVLLALRPELVGNTQVEQRLLPGMIKGLSGQGAKPTTEHIAGHNVVVATTKSTHIVAWYRSGVVALVIGNGTDAAPTLAFAKAYLAAG